MKKTSHGSIGHGHPHCADPRHLNIHDQDHDNSMQHDVHALLHPAHKAFDELLKDAIKKKLQKNKSIGEKIEKLADMGYSLVVDHLDIIIEDVTNSFKESKNHHQ